MAEPRVPGASVRLSSTLSAGRLPVPVACAQSRASACGTISAHDRPPSPVGLHRVLEPAGVLPQAARRLDADPDDRRRTRSGSGSSGSTSTRRPSASWPRSTRATATPSAPRCSRSSPRAARCRTRSPAPAACSSAPSRRSARTPPLGLEVGDRVATLVSLSLTPLRITDGLARWDGRSEQVPVRRQRDPVRPLDRRRAPRRPDRRAGAGGHGRLRRTGAHGAGRRAATSPTGTAPDGRRARRSRQVRLAVPGRGAPRRGASHGRRRPDRGRGRAADATAGSPTTSRSPTPATRSRCPPR